ncbi:MAG TPA: hypothetical protein VFH78_01735, partial [Candidatus Thermoplasmatota archaeon]|nr:hypothetical protein [Candidatus Thermoplasmatota archaeon]
MSRCLPKLLVASCLAAALLAPAAQAQVVPAFTLAATAVDADALPGEEALYNVTVGNPSQLLAREARMGIFVPAGWTANFTV